MWCEAPYLDIHDTGFSEPAGNVFKLHVRGCSQNMQRPISDGVIYGQYNERRIEYEDVLLSERTDSQYSQSESYLSER